MRPPKVRHVMLHNEKLEVHCDPRLEVAPPLVSKGRAEDIE